MRRGEIYRVKRPSHRDPKKFRAFIVVSRQVLIDSRFSTVVCAPIYSSFDGLSTQVQVGPDEGLKHECGVHCDELVSLPKAILGNYLGGLTSEKLNLLDKALKVALQLQDE